MLMHVHIGRGVTLALAAAVALVVNIGSSAAERADVPQPLVGIDYYATDCIHGGTGLLKDAPDPVLEREQLYAMHASGLNSLRLTINYTSDTGLINGGHGGAIAIDPDGTIGEPYRSRFIRYLIYARDAGFADVTIAFYPYGPNSPAPYTTGTYVYDWDPSLYPADWRFVQDVRDLTKQYGPPESHFDLMAEGPPSDGDRQQVGSEIDAFMSRLYSDYVTKYGSADVFFTAIGNQHERLAHLIDDLESTGKPLPQWWGLDIQYTHDGATSDLAAADATLQAYGLPGSFALGETAYEDGGVAEAVQTFNATVAHKVVQVEEYPNWGEPGCWSAPYTGDAYLKVLGIEPGPLRASVGAHGQLALTTSDRVPVSALRAGGYTIVVTDRSRANDFHLIGEGVNRHTGLRFTGTRTWTVTLRGGIARYRSDRRHGKQASLFVLIPAS
jgi:hypothetical protein